MEFLEYFGRFEAGLQIEEAKFFLTMLFSMMPVVELRGGLPFGIALGLDLPHAFWAAVIGNLLPVPFIIAFAHRVFVLLRKHIPLLEGLIHKLELRAAEKGELVQKYEFWGLLILVAIPLPGTGAWTGSLAAAFLEMRLKKAMPAVILGVLTAGTIMLTLTHVGINLFSGMV